MEKLILGNIDDWMNRYVSKEEDPGEHEGHKSVQYISNT